MGDMTELGFEDAMAERTPRFDNEPYMTGFERGLWERTRPNHDEA